MHPTDRLPIGGPLVPRGTPLHVTEIILLLLKQTFAGLPAHHPYRFDNDYATTGILIDTTLNKDSGIYGKKPIIIVSRGPVSDQPLALGDMASMHLPTLHAHRTGFIRSSINLRVLSRAKQECEIVSQLTFNFLKQYKMLLPQLVGLHSIEGVTLSEIQRFEEDDEMFLNMLSWAYTMQMTWTEDHAAPVLSAVDVVLGARPAY